MTAAAGDSAVAMSERKALSASATSRDVCCYCGTAFRPLRASGRAGCEPDAASRDHILPRERGRAGQAGPGRTNNIRICCRRCNELRGGMRHCTGALLIFLGLLPETSADSVRQLGRVWAASSPVFAGLPR